MFHMGAHHSSSCYTNQWGCHKHLFLKQSRQELLQLGRRFGNFDALKHSLHDATHNSI